MLSNTSPFTRKTKQKTIFGLEPTIFESIKFVCNYLD